MGEAPVARGPLMSPGYHLWKASLRWSSAVAEALAALELTHVQFFVLGAVNWLGKTRGESPNQSEVAAFSGMDPMMVSKVVRALATRGLLERSEDPVDTRAWRIRVTAQGLPKLISAVALVAKVDAAFFGSAAPSIKTQLEMLSRD